MVPLVTAPADIPYTFQGLIRFVASKNCLGRCLRQYETIICYTPLDNKKEWQGAFAIAVAYQEADKHTLSSRRTPAPISTQHKAT